MQAVRKGLTQAKILEESRALMDAGGEAALTMRALAARLAVAPMALYNHFRDRDAILDALADGVFESLRQSAAQANTRARREKHWRRKLRIVLLDAQELAARHPHVYRMAFTRPKKPASAFALAADSMRLLQEAGLDRAQSLTAYHAFVILLEGYPFWREGLEKHGAGMAAGGSAEDHCLPNGLLPARWTAERQFAAIVDWLLSCVEEMGRGSAR